MEVIELSKDQIELASRGRIQDADVVLDVGCGIRPARFFLPVTHICVEPFAPYLAGLPQDRTYILFNSTWDSVLPTMADKSVDTVFLLDVIEHIEKDQGQELLRQAQRLARKQVVVFTPLGFYPQSYDEDSTDRWGYQGGYWQTHRSGWLPEDFGPGWTILTCSDYHEIDQNEGHLDEGFGALWAFWNAGDPNEEPEKHRALRRMLPWFRVWLDEVLPHWFFRILVRLNSQFKIL